MSALASLIGGVGGLLLGPWILAMMAFSFAFPFMWFSAVSNLAKSRRALERIADAMELPSRAGGSGVLKL